jgi:hypothetical protein
LANGQNYVLALGGPDEDLALQGDLDIYSPVGVVVKVDAAAGIATIDGNANDRVFNIVNAGASLTLEGITVTNGSVIANGGGGILNQGGSLTLLRSAVDDNFADQFVGSGGGIFNSGGTVLVMQSSVSGNQLGTDGDFGGGIWTSGGSVTLIESVVNGNTSDVDGGGIFVDFPGELLLTDSTVSGNRAGPGVSANGGGIWNSGTMTLVRSTVGPGNSALSGGGIFNDTGTATISNSTVSGNSSEGGGGGGIFNTASGGTITLTNVTVAFNQSAPLGPNSGINNQGAPEDVSIVNTIVAENTPVDCSGPVDSLGNNLDSDGTCITNGVNNDITGNASLGPLQNNGGPTETHALLPGSDAIDAGDDAVCQNEVTGSGPTDQRGLPRSEGASCDIGAYEVQMPDLMATKFCVGDGFEAAFTLTVATVTEAAACGGSVTAPDLAPGDYTVSEEISGPDAESFTTVIACDGGAPVEASSTTVNIPLDSAEAVTCVVINLFEPDGAADGDGAAGLICFCSLDLEIDIGNENTNVIGIDNENENENANDNSNTNTNDNANQNTQDQDNAQDQDNGNQQANNITSSPEVNIDFGE